MKNDALLNHLLRLKSAGSITSSSLTSAIYKELENIGVSRGFLTVEKSGRGKCLKVINSQILESEIKRISPDIDSIENLPDRVQNLAINRDTKAGDKTLDFSYYTCKAVGENVIVDGIDVSAITNALGCFSLPVKDDSNGVCDNGILLLVENQLMLDDLKWIPAEFKGVVLYYAGNLSDRLLNWIRHSTFAEVWLFPDYDAVGINNFARLKNVVPNCKWFWMPNWESKLQKFGNPELRRKGNQQALFENLWNKFKETRFPDAKLQNLMEEIRKNGKMLEQEVALL